MGVYVTQTAALRFRRKRKGKPPRLRMYRPIWGWWTPYIFLYSRMTELLELSKDIRTGIKSIFGCNLESNKGESKHKWHYRLSIIGWSRPQELFHLPTHEMVLSAYMMSSQHCGYLKKR
eukprot:8545073-Ditylum_brightwellii.AAC.1